LKTTKLLLSLPHTLYSLYSAIFFFIFKPQLFYFSFIPLLSLLFFCIFWSFVILLKYIFTNHYLFLLLLW
jgi:hypothetical protein